MPGHTTNKYNMRYVEMTQQKIADLNDLSDLVKRVNDPALYIQNTRETEKYGRPYHLRTLRKVSILDKDEAEQLLRKVDSSITLKPTSAKLTSYTQAAPFEFQHQGKTFYIATRRKVESGGKSVKGFNKKELTPVTLGLGNVYTSKKELYQDIKRLVIEKYEDDRQNALLHVLDNAMQFGSQKPMPEELQYVLTGTNLKQISQDFGECIAPLCYADDSQTIEFPPGNEPVVDVIVGGQKIAVKSLSGSGNSLVKMKKIVDTYKDTIDPKDLQRQARYATIQKLADPGRSVINLILELCTDLKTPEMVQLIADTIPNISITKLDDLIKAVKVLIYKDNKLIPYQDVIAKCKVILGASQHKVFGIPRDVATTGEKKFQRDPVQYTAYMLTYGLGKGLENVIVRGIDKDAYAEIIKDIMTQVEASVGFVGVNANGIIDLKIKKFSDLDFKFDYHAFTTNPGNNRPGFAIISN